MKFIFAIVFIVIVQNAYAQQTTSGVCPKPKYVAVDWKTFGHKVGIYKSTPFTPSNNLKCNNADYVWRSKTSMTIYNNGVNTKTGKNVSERIEADIVSKTTLSVKYGKGAFERNYNILKVVPEKCVVAYGCKNLDNNKKSELYFVLADKADSDVSECVKALADIGVEPSRLYKNDLSNCKDL